jgi:periplasmic protein TonB
MLDQLVESKSNADDNNRKSGFLLTTFFLMSSLLVGGWLYSLFAKEYGMGDGDLELSTLVAPVPVPEEEPPPPPEKQPEIKQKVEPNVDLRKELIQNIMTTPKEPTKIETAKQTTPAMRLNVTTKQSDQNYTTSAPRGERDPVVSDTSGIGSGNPGGTQGGTGNPPPPPPPPPPPAAKPSPPAPPKITKPVSGGVLNGKATSLPKPPYPAAARAVRASGAVSVQVLIGENGSVISASAVSGHPLLRQAAEQAARGARFSPTTLSGQAVKVSGIITYNFVP